MPQDRRTDLPEGNMFRAYGNDEVSIPDNAQGELVLKTGAEYEAERKSLSEQEVTALPGDG